MSAPIFNREFQHPADGWYQVEAKGFHPATAKDGTKVVQVIDNKAIQSIVSRFNADAQAKRLEHGNEMLIDHEHFKHDSEKESRAYGWATQLRASPDGSGIDMMNRWTATGKPAVDGGDYRFFSTEYSNLEKVPDSEIPSEIYNKYKGYKFLRPLQLDGLSLTNMNNNRGQRPITNRAWNPGDPPSGMTASQADTSEVISTPALDEWFSTVAKVQHAARKIGTISLDFYHAWELAKAHYPGEYAAAFGLASQSPTKGAANDTAVNAARKQVTEITNRIQKAAGTDFKYSFNFVQENLPNIFNRMTPSSELILNRERNGQDSVALKNVAAKIFNRLVREVEFSSGLPSNMAWQQVMSGESTMHDLASARITPEEAFSIEPELRERLTSEIT